MTTLLIIIGVLLLTFSVVLNIYLLRNTHVIDGWDNEDMKDFAQSVTNYEVTDHELREWISVKELEQIRFSDN